MYVDTKKRRQNHAKHQFGLDLVFYVMYAIQTLVKVYIFFFMIR